MYKCSNGCEYEHHHRGAMNIHEKIHCKQKTTPTGEGAKAEVKAKAKATPVGCVHEWAFLGHSKPEILAKRQGFYKYCRKCEEIE